MCQSDNNPTIEQITAEETFWSICFQIITLDPLKRLIDRFIDDCLLTFNLKYVLRIRDDEQISLCENS